jgi:outer membrane lipoprotein SlyB
MNDSADRTGNLQQVRATFATPAQMQDAVGRLSLAGFDRADMSLPSPGLLEGAETPETGTKPVSTDVDAQQARVLGASTAAAVVGMAAAGITVATGGAAAPAVAAAAVAGGAAGGSVFAARRAVDEVEQDDRDTRAATGELVLAVRAPTLEKRSEAEEVLRASGATNIELI